MHLRNVSFAAVLFFSICISSTVLSDSNKPADPGKSENDSKFLIEPLVGMGKLHFGMTRDEMIKILGQPQGRKSYDPNINDYTKFGFSVIIHDGVVDKILCGFDPTLIAKCKCVTTKGIKMGSTRQQIIEAYGEPSKANGRVLKYENIRMDFTLKDDKVMAILARMQSSQPNTRK